MISHGTVCSRGVSSRILGAGVIACALTVLGCAGRTPAPDAPVIIAGSVCSGLPKLRPPSVDRANAKRGTARADVAAWISEPIDDKSAQELAVFELGTEKVGWRTPVRAVARPQILEDIVMTATADRHVVAFDLATGTERFQHELDRPAWIGAAQSGKTVVITTGASSWDPRERGSSLIALDATSGSLRWSRELPYALTRPVIANGRVLVVADRADLLTLDLESGADTGCGPIGGNTVEWIESDGTTVRFGASEARMLGADGRASAATLELPREDLPGRPFPRDSSYQPQPATRSAHGRVAIIAPLHTSDHGPMLTRAGFYFVFYRDVFAFHADGRLAWAQLMDADVARAAAAPAGLWVVTESGELALLAADSGRALTRRAVGLRVASADFRTGQAFEPARAPQAPPEASPLVAAAATPTPVPPPPAAELQARLKQLAQDTDARLLPARMFAVDELARVETSSASADLLDIYSAPNTPRGLQDRIEKRLRERKLGAEILVAALDQHEDFLDERPAPPLRAIVPGLVTQREKRAVPGLVAQLFDPDTRRSDLGMLVSAIDALGGESAQEPLARFFAMYRADSELREEPDALVRAASALVAREQAANRSMLEATRDSELTAPPLREELTNLLAPPPSTVSEPVAEPVVAAAPQAAPAVDLRSVLDGARPAFEPCIQALQSRAPKLVAVRMWFVAQPDGIARDVHAIPTDRELATCLGAKLAQLRLPSERKQLVSYGFVVQPSATAVPDRKPKQADSDEFWSAAERRAPKSAAISKAPPWWLDKNPLFVAIDTAPPPTLLVPARGPAPAAPKSAPATPPDANAQSAPAPAAAPAASAAPPDDAWWVPVQPAKP